jgi:hypothetical protein
VALPKFVAEKKTAVNYHGNEAMTWLPQMTWKPTSRAAISTSSKVCLFCFRSFGDAGGAARRGELFAGNQIISTNY